MNPTSLQEESRTAFRILFAISIAHLLNDMVQSIVPSIYPIIKEEMGLSFIQIGVITLVFQLTSSLLQPFVGMYADRRPSPYALAAGMCFTLTGLIWLAFTGSYAAMLGAVSVIGIGSSIFHPEASRVAQLARRQKGYSSVDIPGWRQRRHGHRPIARSADCASPRSSCGAMVCLGGYNGRSNPYAGRALV